MSDITVRFCHPVDSRLLTVTLDGTMTAQEAVSELIGANFIQPSPHGYNVAIKGGALIGKDQQFQDLKLTSNDIVNVIPATDAGQA